MQFVNGGFNILKVNGSTHVHMLIINYVWKKLPLHSHINVGFFVITCLLINCNKCKI
jgi:hypothetical protein